MDAAIVLIRPSLETTNTESSATSIIISAGTVLIRKSPLISKEAVGDIVPIPTCASIVVLRNTSVISRFIFMTGYV